ncbi:hypothetical protein J6590_029437 [Homalodisca vitripennis]|nr:hypothetical protein J6590_029437 [Homalodisca vitripennis]
MEISCWLYLIPPFHLSWRYILLGILDPSFSPLLAVRHGNDKKRYLLRPPLLVLLCNPITEISCWLYLIPPFHLSWRYILLGILDPSFSPLLAVRHGNDKKRYLLRPPLLVLLCNPITEISCWLYLIPPSHHSWWFSDVVKKFIETHQEDPGRAVPGWEILRGFNCLWIERAHVLVVGDRSFQLRYTMGQSQGLSLVVLEVGDLSP